MKIDLGQYGQELEHWLRAIEPFTEIASVPALRRVREDLLDGAANRPAELPWKLTKPILCKPARQYDGVDKSPHAVQVQWQFEARFTAPTRVGKRWIWTVSEMVTQTKVCLLETGDELLHFHHDLKNKDQLGPHVHMQVSEHWLKENKPVPIAVPRFPAAVVLPTDCLDLILSEFFPHEWPKSQADAVGIGTLIDAQKRRMMAMSAAVAKSWDAKPRKTPIAAVQNCYLPDLQLA